MNRDHLDEMQGLIDQGRQLISAMQAIVNALRARREITRYPGFDAIGRDECQCLEHDPFECAARALGIIYPAEVNDPCECACHDGTDILDDEPPYDPSLEAKLRDKLEEGR